MEQAASSTRLARLLRGDEIHAGAAQPVPLRSETTGTERALDSAASAHLLRGDELHAGAAQLVALGLHGGGETLCPARQPCLSRGLLPVCHHRRARLPRPAAANDGEALVCVTSG